MKSVQSEIRKVIKDFGKEIVTEKRFVYILSDYGVLKDLYAERRILTNMIEDGYAKLIYELSLQNSSASLKVCSYVSEMHTKYGYQIRKIITVCSWITEGLNMPKIPFDSILQINNDNENIKEIYIKGKFKVKSPKSEITNYSYPLASLFPASERSCSDYSPILQHIRTILSKYQIAIESVEIVETPAFLFFDIQLSSDVRLSKLLYLQDEIASAIVSNGCRMEVPILGTNHIGIEYPKDSPQNVEPFHVFSHSVKEDLLLPCLIGIQPNGSLLKFDLSKIGNILITGIPQSGKSNCIHSIIGSILFNELPSDVKFTLIDLHNVEYNCYNKISNSFLADYANGEVLVSSKEQAIVFFRNLKEEIAYRLSLLSSSSTNNISEYNSHFLKGDLDPELGYVFLPYLVVVIDEFLDLNVLGDISQTIASISKECNIVGIHLIIASRSRIKRSMMSEETKNSFNGRISFKQDSSIDSKAILNNSSATLLTSKADAYYFDSSLSTPLRFTNTLFDLNTRMILIDFISHQPSFKSPYKLQQVSQTLNQNVKSNDKNTVEGSEDLIKSAEMIIQQRQCSEALLQKTFSYTYNHAHRILLDLEGLGIVKKVEGIWKPTISSVDELKKII